MSQYPAVIGLSSLHDQFGFTAVAEYTNAHLSTSVASAGDVNGDGFADFIVGAQWATPNGAASGASYVVFGNPASFGSTLDLTALNGANGFQINGGAANDYSGSSVAAGDINGDGFTDLIVGAWGADPHGSNSGASYVVFGKAGGFATHLDLSSLNGGNGFKISGETAGDFSGRSVSAGDVNGDGFADLIIGAWGANSAAGSSYVVFGKAAGFGANLDLSSLDGTNGFKISGEGASDRSGLSVSSAGDVNGDGIDDFIIGAYGAHPHGNVSGSSYVVFGKAGLAANLDLSSLNGTNGFKINGEASLDSSGRSVSAAGDVNGDGFADLIIGAPGGPYSSHSGAYVVFGKAAGFGASLDLSSLDGSNGFRANGQRSTYASGFSVSSAGDVNGDGFSDLLIGAPGAFMTGGGHVIFGKAGGFGAIVDYSTSVNNGSTGFELDSGDGNAGTSVALAGDINGDGFSDLLIGDWASAHIVFGRMPDVAVNRVGTNAGQILAGGNFGDVLSGLGGNDELVGNRGNDTLIGGQGTDILTGGAGTDTFVFGALADIPASLATADHITDFGSQQDLIDFSAIGSSTFIGTAAFSHVAGQINYLFSGNTTVLQLDRDGNGLADAFVVLDDGRFALTQTTPGSRVLTGMSQFPAVIELSNLDGSNGFQVNGATANDESGYSVSSAGDINGDGFADFLIGARQFTNHGASYLVFGRASGFGPNLEVSSLDGHNGFKIDGEGSGGHFGSSAASAGDVNGDGLDDLIIGAPSADPNGKSSAGSSYVVFGKASGFGAVLDVSSLNGSNGFQINGEVAGDGSGFSVSSAGDVNGDGFADVLIGAWGADPHGSSSGASYVVFGKASGFSANLELSSLDGSNGFQINGEAANDYSGRCVSSAGDVNGDGFADLVIGAQGADPHGASYVVFGKASGFGANFELSSLDGSNGFQINGEATNAYNGRSVSSAGDINGDGFSDLIIGAWGTNTHGLWSGASYVIFGKAAGFGANVDLSSLDGSNGFQINGEVAYDQSGFSVSSAGDVNGDGFDDLIIAAQYASPNGFLSGASYVVFGKAEGFEASLDLASLTGVNGFRINGEAAGDFFRGAVSSAGDINRDGFADMIVGAPGADPNGSYSGTSYIVFGRMPDAAVTHFGTSSSQNLSGGAFNDTLMGFGGNDTLFGHDGNDILAGGAGRDTAMFSGLRAVYTITAVGPVTTVSGPDGNDTLTGIEDLRFDDVTMHLSLASQFPATLDLSSLNGSNGFKINGEAAYDYSGLSVASAGDVNGDGFADFIIGAKGADPNGSLSGASYVVFGKATSFGATLQLSSLDGTNGFKINGEAAGDVSAWSVSSAGDVNGDGFADLIIGAPWADPNGAYSGASYVVFGKASGFAANLDLSSLNGANGFKINGEAGGNQLGRSVSSAGDINGDGFADIIVGAESAAPNGLGSGASYVIFGKASGFASSLDLSSLNGTNGFKISGVAPGDYSGFPVSSAGDVNGDGFADLLIGASQAGPNGTYSGASYVVFGKASGFAANLDLSSLNGSNGFKISGEAANDQSGYSLSSAGDINGDGFADIIIGALGAGPHGVNSGASYVVFGKASGFAANIDLSSLNGSNGFKISGEAANNYSGHSVSSAGDVNGDGFDDIIIGAFRADPNGPYSGASYVMFGKASGFGANVDLSTLTGVNGFKINGAAGFDQSGQSVSSAGDINGDGFADLIVGAPYASPNGGDSGSSYVVYGHATPPFLASTSPADDATNVAVDANIVLTFNETVIAGSGNFTIHKSSDDSVVANMAVTDASLVSFSGSVVTINPASDLAPGTSYYLTVASGVVTDIAGDPYAGISSTTAFDFSTRLSAQSDFNSDGNSDILWQNSNGQPEIWLTNGTSLLLGSPVGSNPGPSWHVKGASDFDGDGKSDILWQNDSGQPGVWLMNSFARVVGSTVGPNPGAAWHVKGAGDFNGDGKADILWQNNDGSAGVWLMSGTTVTAAASVGNNPGSAWHVKGAGDFNGDGKADILWQNDSGQAAIWLMNGTSLISGTTIGPNPGSSWHVKDAGDFNGDGKADILWQNNDGSAGVWLMSGMTVTAAASVGNNPGPAWHVEHADDFNGDGQADVLWQNDNGQGAVWLMDGLTLLSGAQIGNNLGTAWHLDWGAN